MNNHLILVLNCGSSSVKFAVLNPDTDQTYLSGLVQAIGLPEANIKYKENGQTIQEPLANIDHHHAVQTVLNLIKDRPALIGNLRAIGHRIVHGGESFTQSVIVTPEILEAIRATELLAPLHTPAHIAGIEEAFSAFAELPQVAVFDTAFHQTMPPHAYLYALPYELYQKQAIRKYGFHGTSHRFVSNEAARILKLDPENSSFVTAHLGNGCSVAAIANGKSIDTTMGLTPLDGLMMGTRSGDVDPNLHQHLVDHFGYTLAEVTNMLNKQSGMLGISGLSSDLRIIEDEAEKGNERAALALEMFSYRLAKYIAAYAVVALGKLDALIFTGGIGENSRVIRAATVKHLAMLGFKLDTERNAINGKNSSGIITQDGSTVAIVVPTNEELMIARDTLSLVTE